MPDPTDSPAASQRPANLAEAVRLLSTRDPYDRMYPELLLKFVGDLIGEYPNFVMEKVMVMRSAWSPEALREYRGEF